MTSDGPIFLVSDLHLGHGTSEERTREGQFFDFLEHVRAEGRALYLLGDLFEVWVEYRRVVPRSHLRILNRLLDLQEAGLDLHYWLGNHDFWFGPPLDGQLNLVVHPGPTMLTLGGLQAYIAHGDGLRPDDRSYRVLRALLRNRLTVPLYRLVHPDLGLALAHRMAEWSRARHRPAPTSDRLEGVARRLLKEGVADLVVFGHSHHPNRVEVDGRVYLNVGDWITHFTYGHLGPGGARLLRWPNRTEIR